MKKHILFATLFALGLSGVSASDGASATSSDPDAIAAQAFIERLRAMRGEGEIQREFDRLTNGVRAHVCSDANRVRVPVTKRFTLAKICDAWEGKGKAYRTDFSDARGDVAGMQARVAAEHRADAARVSHTEVDARGDVSGAKDALVAGSTSTVRSSRDEAVRMDPRARAAFSEPQEAAATSKSAATLEAERLEAQRASDLAFRAAMERKEAEAAQRHAREAEERLARERAEFERAQEDARRAREAAEEAARKRAEAEAKLAREKAAAGKIASAYKGSLEVKAAQAELERLRAERAERDAREAAAKSARATDAWARMGAGAKAADKEKRFADARADLADMRAREARAADGLGGLAARLAEKRQADARAEATAMGEVRRVEAEARAAEEARLARERAEAAERARLEEEAAAREAAAAEEEAARAAISADDAAASGGGDGVSAPYFDAYGKSPAEIAALVAQWERDALPLRGSITRFPMTNPGPTVAPDHLRRVAAVAGSFERLEELFWGWSTAVDDSVVAAFFAGAGSEPFVALSEVTFETTVITDGTARSVAAAMAAGRLPSLTRLSLSGGAQASNKYGSPVGPKMGGLTEAGALAIVTQLGRTPRLTELTLGDEALVAHAAAIEAAARSARAAAAGPLPELKIRLGGWGEAGKEITLPAKPA